METRKSIDDCSGEEWSAAARSHWEHHLKEREIYQKDPEGYLANKYNRVYEEDPVYSKQEDLFDTPLFEVSPTDDDLNRQQTMQMLDEEHRFEQLVQVLGPYYAIGYCHGAALEILMDPDNGLSSKAVEVAKLHLTRMARLIDQTEGVNW